MLLQDIREVRQAKCRDGLSKLDHSELSVRVLSHLLCTQLIFVSTLSSATKPLRNGDKRNSATFRCRYEHPYKASEKSRGAPDGLLNLTWSRTLPVYAPR